MNNIRKLAKRIYDLSPIAWELGFPYHNCGNFSLLPLSNGGWFACFRIFAYYIDRFGRYLTSPTLLLKQPHIHQFCILDHEFNLVRKLQNIKSDYWHHPMFDKEYPYLEDGRLVIWRGTPYISSTVCYLKNGRWNAVGVEVQRLDINGGEVSATHVWNTIENGIGGIQKNWLPIEGRPFNYICGTSTNGTQVIDLWKKGIQQVGDFDANDLLRGNTPLLKTQNGWIGITHKVTPASEQNPIKTYYNFIVEYDENLKPNRISKPFKLSEKPIEFVTSMNDMPNSEIVIGVTEMDETAFAMVFDKKDLFGDDFIKGVNKIDCEVTENGKTL